MRGATLNLHNAEFIRSAVKAEDFPKDRLPQIVFAGKSNVGKSSTINRLLNRKNFARVGNSPGKTIHINYFLIDKKAYFVDLPGYGYAKVSKKEKERWSSLLEEYFSLEDTVTLGIQIVDIRHKPTQEDVTMSQWFLQTHIPYIVIANKSDKIKKGEIEGQVRLIRQTMKLPELVEVIPFSAEKGDSRDRILDLIISHAEI